MKYYPPPNLAVRSRTDRMSGRGGPAHGDPARERRRDGPPRRDHPPRHQAGERPRQPVRPARAHRLRHRRSGRARRGRRRGRRRLGAVVAARGALRPVQRRLALRRLLPRRHAVAPARRALAVRAAGRRQLRLRPHAAHPGRPGPDDRPRRRPRLARAAARARDVEEARHPPADRPRARPRAPGRRAGAAAARAPPSSSSTRRATPPSPRCRAPAAAPRATTTARSVRTPTSVALPETPRPPRPVAAESEEDAPTTVSGGVILGVIGLLLVGLVGALFWALGRDDEPTAQPSASVRTQTGAPTRAVDYPEQPAIDARSGRRVGDLHVELRRRRGGRLLPAAGGRRGGRRRRRDRAAGHRGRQAHRQGAPTASLVCAQVTVARKSGITSPRSAIRCQTAG